MLAPRKPINQSKIPFAIKKSDGEIVSIDDVPAGLACDCVCPGCHADLVGKKGMQGRTHHFAHYKASQDLCQFAALTSIRLMLLAELTHKRHPGVQAIALPDITGEVTAKDSVRRVTQNYREPRPVRHAYIHQQNNLFPQILLTLNPTTQPENEAVCIGLYLPQVNPKNEQPDWLGAYVTTWPQRGLLEVHYTTLYAMLFERAIETPVTECLLHSLFTSKRALRWLYHPDEGAIRRNKEERLIRDLTEANERRRRLQAEARRQMGGTTGKQGGLPGEQSSPWPSHCAWGLECRFCGQLIVNPSSAQICDQQACIDKWHELADQHENNRAEPVMSPEQLRDLIVSTGWKPDDVPLINCIHQLRIDSGWFVLTEREIWFIYAWAVTGETCNVRYSAGMRTGYCLPRSHAIVQALTKAQQRPQR